MSSSEAPRTTSIASTIFKDHFVDKTVAVTGAGRGIGLGIAQAFAESGANVLLIDRDRGVMNAANEMAASGLSAVGVQADLTVETDVVAAFGALEQLGNSLDVLVNNAGIITIGSIDELSVEDFERVLAVNTTAIYASTKVALPYLRAGGSGGAILNASSGQGRQGFIFTPHYAASKFGVIGMSQSLAKELAPENIRVNCYCPGIVETPMWEYNDREWGKRLGSYEPGELIREWIDSIPMQRAATASDVANALLFLASDAGQYITGQALNIDGGMFMN